MLQPKPLSVEGFSRITGQRSFTIGHVALIRQWLASAGFPSTMQFERQGNRNIMMLVITLPEGVLIVEARWLNGYYIKHLPQAQLGQLLMEKWDAQHVA